MSGFTQAPNYAQQQQPNVQFQQVNPAGQVNPNFQQQYGQQNSAQQFRSADPNAQNYNQTGYTAPNTFQQNAAGQYYQGVTYKSKVTAGLLGIFLGAFGVHNFYLGYTSKAVIQLLLTVLSCGTLSPISAVWGLIEGIMLLTGSINQDGKGLPLKD
ncbi:MAG: TM2 domain-containing protein [Oscillospiraceae bacterium]|nr:TM2 domain-containing protein [Oscillospiraceae bacterium]